MADLIDRQAAIDAFGLSEKTRKYGGDHSGYDTRMLYEIQDTLEDLPAVQPEIIRCKDCRFNDGTAYCVFHFRDVKGEGYCSWAERRTDG